MNAPSNIFASDCCETSVVTCTIIGQITNPGDVVEMHLPADTSVVGVEVVNKGDGTLGFQMSVDGINWVLAQMFAQPGDLPVTATDTDGTWRGSVAGMSMFRVAAGDDYAGSMATVTLRASPADLFINPEHDVLPPVQVIAAAIDFDETGTQLIVPGVVDRKVLIHRVKFGASDIIRIRFENEVGPALSGWEICDTQVLDIDMVHPWYETLPGTGFSIHVLTFDGTGEPPTPLPIVVGGTVWYSLSPIPVVFP